MESASKLIRDFDHLLVEKEIELITLREAAWTFLNQEHVAKDIQEYQSQVLTSGEEIGAILRWLLEEKEKSELFRPAANDLCQRCRSLFSYTDQMFRALSQDFAYLHEAETKAKFDLVKNAGFLFAIPGFFIAAQKAGVGENHVNVTQATILGFGVSSSILFHKKIGNSFKEMSSAICNAPQQIRNSFTVFYVRETLRENQIKIMRTVEAGYGGMSLAIPNMASKARSIFKRPSDKPEAKL